MNQHLISACMWVLLIAVLQTAAMVCFVMGTEHVRLPSITAIFSLFMAFTASVLCLAYHHFYCLLKTERDQDQTARRVEKASIETTVKIYSDEWRLTKAEAEVALYVVKGFSNIEIAELRGAALPTIKTQLSKVYEKSKLGSRYQLMAFIVDEMLAPVGSQFEAIDAPTRHQRFRQIQTVDVFARPAVR